VDKPLVLYDGVCHLCNGSVRFIIRRDPAKQFQFGQLQSASGRSRLEGFPTTGESMNTLVLLEAGKIYTKSTAVLRIARRLSGGWPLFYAFIVMPPFMRDTLYNVVSRYRYRWFGRSEKCMLPSQADMDRFID